MTLSPRRLQRIEVVTDGSFAGFSVDFSGFTLVDPNDVADRRKFAIVPFLPIADKTLRPLYFRVLVAMCSYANKSKRLTWVGQTRLADDLGVSQPTIHRAMKELRRRGYIKYGRRPPQKYGRSQTYLIVFGEPTPEEDGLEDYDAELARVSSKGYAPPVSLSGTHGPKSTESSSEADDGPANGQRTLPGK